MDGSRPINTKKNLRWVFPKTNAVLNRQSYNMQEDKQGEISQTRCVGNRKSCVFSILIYSK